jgi:DnaK suppressor protein
MKGDEMSTATHALAPMTQAELLAASPDDYMSDRQLAFFRDLLEKEHAVLLEAARETSSHLRENESTPDWTDRASVEEEHTIELRVRDRERKLLKKIEKALSRITEGEYGYCEETGEPIGLPRLLARPTATLSLEAQERREKYKKLHGG